MRRLVERTEDRRALEALGDRYAQRLHRRSNDFAATDGLRLVTAKLRIWRARKHVEKRASEDALLAELVREEAP